MNLVVPSKKVALTRYIGNSWQQVFSCLDTSTILTKYWGNSNCQHEHFQFEHPGNVYSVWGSHRSALTTRHHLPARRQSFHIVLVNLTVGPGKVVNLCSLNEHCTQNRAQEACQGTKSKDNSWHSHWNNCLEQDCFLHREPQPHPDFGISQSYAWIPFLLQRSSTWTGEHKTKCFP